MRHRRYRVLHPTQAAPVASVCETMLVLPRCRCETNGEKPLICAAKYDDEGHIKGFLQSADGVTVNTATVANRGEQHWRHIDKSGQLR